MQRLLCGDTYVNTYVTVPVFCQPNANISAPPIAILKKFMVCTAKLLDNCTIAVNNVTTSIQVFVIYLCTAEGYGYENVL